MVVDDDPTVGPWVRAALEPVGYAVLHTIDPLEAIRVGKKRPHDIDLLLVDVVMPLMDGRKLARRMRSLCPRIGDMGSPISMRPVGHLSRNLSAWNNSRNRSPLRYERKHLRPWPATARGSRPVLMFCRDAKAQSFSARHSGCGSWVRGFWPVIGIRNAGDLWRQCQEIQSRVLAPDRDIHRCRGNQTRLLAPIRK